MTRSPRRPTTSASPPSSGGAARSETARPATIAASRTSTQQFGQSSGRTSGSKAAPKLPLTDVIAGRYAIIRRIGEGGMAEVFLARDSSNGNVSVVVKRCRAHLKHQPETAESFLREARLAQLIRHPNVVRVDATGEDDGLPYLVMEYLQGLTIRDVFLRATSDGGVPTAIAARIVMESARGLDAAHFAVDESGAPMGLVHRDVSPHNLFVTDAGTVKVLDFGIAKGTNDVTMTRAGHVKGKASYLAPEQLSLTGRPDARADLFSLGIVFWELLTGKRLFKRATETATVEAVRSLPIPDAIEVRGAVDPGLSAIAARMLARNPDDRPARGQEVADGIAHALAELKAIDPQAAEADVATYVVHLRQVAPATEERLLPDPPSSHRRAASAPIEPLSSLDPSRQDESTATVGPPVAGARHAYAGNVPTPKPSHAAIEPAAPHFIAMNDGEGPLDGSVVGTWAIAGAPRPAADLSGGFPESATDDDPKSSRR
ncbi:MAG: serine/threonine-protein kinase, partial [Polyangiales bacterium]